MTAALQLWPQPHGNGAAAFKRKRVRAQQPHRAIQFGILRAVASQQAEAASKSEAKRSKSEETHDIAVHGGPP